MKRLCSPARMWRRRSMTVSSWRANRPELSRSLLNPASPHARLDALSTNLIGLGKRRGGIVDAKLQSDGKSDQAEGKIQNAVGGVTDAVRDALKK